MNKYADESRRAQAERKRARACGMKVAYPSAEAAFQKGQHVYQCQYCRLWHRSGSLARLAAAVRSRRT